MFPLLCKTFTVISIGRSSLPRNGWRVITDRKVRVPSKFRYRPQVLTSRVLAVEARNVHGERLDKELSVTEFIHNMRNAPRFAHQGGISHHPYTYTPN